MKDKFAQPEQTLIRPPGSWTDINIRELWRYRELLAVLALRDLKIRYKQTVLGLSWVVLPPLITMVIFNVLFGFLLGKTGKPTIPGIPYAISMFCAMVPWQFFSNSFSKSANSLVSSRALITKVYFPRLIIPVVPVIAASLDFLITLLVFFLIVIGFHFLTDFTYQLSWTILWSLFLFILILISALAFSLWFSALNAIYRDFQYIIPFFIQFLFFLSPIVYTSSTILENQPQWLMTIYYLNPIAGIIEGFRWSLLGVGEFPALPIFLSFSIISVLFFSGLFFFRRIEHIIADIV